MNNKVPSSVSPQWDVEEELETLRIELQKELEEERSRLLSESQNIELRLDSVSANTIENTHAEWKDFETRLGDNRNALAKKIKEFRTALAADSDKGPDISALYKWAFHKITNLEE
jgi:Skp family chaperone for outer membrane proteins